MSDIIRGAPLTQTGSAVYQAPPSMMQNLASLGLGAYGLSSLFGGSGAGQASKAAGGSVNSYARGGSVTSREFKEYAVDNVPPQLLPTVQQNAQARNDMDTYQLALERMAQDAAIRRGISGALPDGVDVVRAAGGGIVAFSGDEDGNDPQTGQQVSDGAAGDQAFLAALASAGQGEDARSVEAGDANMYRSASQAALNTARQIAELKQEGYTPEEIQAIVEKNFAMYNRMAGPSPYGKLQQYLEESRAAGAGNLQQAKGLAALKAAAAVLQPGGTMRGLAAAGATFGESYAKAQEAAQAEKRALAQMQFHLDDAQRKERMGYTKDAIAAAAAADKSKRDAATAKLNRLKAMGDIQAKVATANRPFKISGAGGAKEPKGFDALADAEYKGLVASGEKPGAETRRMAYRNAANLWGKQPGEERTAVGMAGVESKMDLKVADAVQKAKFTPEYLEARTDAERAAILERAAADVRKQATAGGPRVNKNSPDNAPTRLKFNEKGELISQ